MPRQIPDKQMSRLSQFVTRWLGLHFPRKRWRDLERIIVHAAPELGLRDADMCVERLLSGLFSKDQEDILAGRLTIGETYFFREQKSFEALENHILPELIASRRGRDQRLRIWSAGCSSGEEPYSLAILLSRLIPDLRDWNVTILATDINSRALAKAQQGLYAQWSFRGVPEWICQRYFTRTPEGRFELPYGIRTLVTFAVLNLAEDTYPALSTNTNAMDIILCRNVLMYFEQQQQQRVIQGFQRSLLESGWLVVSPCETSPDLSARFETVMFPGAVFYRKTGHGAKPQGIVPAIPDAAAWAGHPDLSRQIVPPPPEPAPPAAAERPVVEEAVHAPPAPPATSPYEEALALYRRGSYGDVADTLSVLLDKGENSGGAGQLFGKAAALMARSLANQGEIASALQWSDKAIAVDKLNAELYYLRATIFQEQGDAPLAIASLKQALYLDQGFVLAHFALGTLTLRLGKPEAGRHFENALELLDGCQDDDPVPGSDGMTAGRLSQVIRGTRESLNLKAAR